MSNNDNEKLAYDEFMKRNRYSPVAKTCSICRHGKMFHSHLLCAHPKLKEPTVVSGFGHCKEWK